MQVSRHFVGAQPSVLRSIPFAPPGPPDQDGITLQNRLLAMGEYSQDEEVGDGPSHHSYEMQSSISLTLKYGG